MNLIVSVYSSVKFHLPRMNYNFIIFKIFDLILPKEDPKRKILPRIKLQSPSTNQKNEKLWNEALKASGMLSS